MKNMKKSIMGVAIIAIILISMMMGSVNAASVTASNTEVKKGDIVTVSVKLDDAAKAVQFVLNYDATKFEYVEKSATTTLGTPTINTKTAGVINLAATNPQETTNEVTLKFKALENTDGASFTVSNFKTNKSEVLANTSVSVKVIEETPVEPEQPTTPEEPTTPEQPTTPEKPTTSEETKKPAANVNTDNANEKVGTNGQVIKKLPQTGAPIFMGAAAIIVVAGIAVAVKRKIK